MSHQRAWAEINLAHLSHNLAAVKARLTPGVKVMGIVKADGYGHGAIPVARTLLAGSVDALGVATCEEGIALRENGITYPILILGFTPERLLPEVARRDIVQTVFSPHGAEALAEQAAKNGKRAAVHIKIDTGMSRLGFLPKPESIQAICEIAENPHLYIAGIYTHFATSDELASGFMLEQQARFEWVIGELLKRGLKIPLKHMANSGAFVHSMRGEGYQGVLLDSVRIGIILYGSPPSPEMAKVCAPLGLKPVMRLLSQVSAVKELPAGTGISYGHTFKTVRQSTIATIPVGYADGYPRSLSRSGQVLINGKLAPITGTICMDQCMADVTDIPGVKPGDPVIMLGSEEEGISADNLAEITGTISYEILCGISKRVPRNYV